MKLAVVARLIWIDYKLNKDRLNRIDICKTFSIATAQAIKDIQTFKKLFPSKIVYDYGKKCYVKPKDELSVWDSRVHDSVLTFLEHSKPVVADLCHIY